MTDRAESWWWLLLFNFILKTIWSVRYAQIALGHRLEVARRDASFALMDLVVQMGFNGTAWVCCTIFLQLDPSYTLERDALEKVKLACLLVSPFAVRLRRAARKALGGAAYAEEYPKFSVPANIGLVIHRINEFMMLIAFEEIVLFGRTSFKSLNM